MPIEEDLEKAEDMRCVAKFVIDHGEVSKGEPAYGIAKIILDQDKGWSSLSPNQKQTFETVAVPRATLECKACGEIIHFDELIFDDGLCTSCRHKWEKMKEE